MGWTSSACAPTSTIAARSGGRSRASTACSTSPAPPPCARRRRGCTGSTWRALAPCWRSACAPASNGSFTRPLWPRGGPPSPGRPPADTPRAPPAARAAPSANGPAGSPAGGYGIPYVNAKHEAEVEALRLAARGLPVVIVNPAHVFGRGDLYHSSTEIVRRFLMRRLPASVDGGLNVIDVADVAAGHLAADERGVPGERYILG